ncbi:MAG TPA: hypothetical protein DHV68_05060 [Dehalococcoidia bacterium]|nr:hypothetical protein [Dehalococcoidia bacterium]
MVLLGQRELPTLLRCDLFLDRAFDRNFASITCRCKLSLTSKKEVSIVRRQNHRVAF